jgi:hypothetical protein
MHRLPETGKEKAEKTTGMEGSVGVERRTGCPKDGRKTAGRLREADEEKADREESRGGK